MTDPANSGGLEHRIGKMTVDRAGIAPCKLGASPILACRRGIAEMEKQPFVSIVVPGYNAVAFLEASLGSFGAQDYPRERYEIIFVDDGSTDLLFVAGGRIIRLRITLRVSARMCDAVCPRLRCGGGYGVRPGHGGCR